MNRLKCIVVCFIATFSINTFSQQPEKQLFGAIDGLAPAAKFGIEKYKSERLSLKASAGFCIVGPSLLSYNFFGTYNLSKQEKSFGFDINIGFLDNYIDFLTPMYSLGLGGGVGVHYRFQNYSKLSFRLGMITGPSVEKKEYNILTIPNFGIEYAFAFNKQSSKNK